MSEADDLAVLFPSPVVVQAGGEAVEVRPVTLGELPALLAVLRGVTGGLDPIAIMVNQPDLAEKLLAVLTRCDPAWLSDLSLDDAAGLMVGALEANRSFFTRNGPALLAALGRTMQGAGLPS